MGGHEGPSLARLAGVGEDVVSRMLGFGRGSDELGLDCKVLLLEVGGEELLYGVFVVGD